MNAISTCVRLGLRRFTPMNQNGCGNGSNSVFEVSRSLYGRMYCSKLPEEPMKQSLWQRLKVMYKDYWYVTVPVHVATSCVWFGSFYQVARSGIDVQKYMKWVGFSDSIIEKVAGSGAGNVAVAYALYKVATPARYFVTVCCSTYAINLLKNRGYIRTAKQISQSSRDIIAKRREQYRAIKSSSSKSPHPKDQNSPN